MASSEINAGSEPDLVCAVDLGGTHLRAGIVDGSGTFLHRLKGPTPRGADPAEIVNAIIRAVHDSQLSIGDRKVLAVSVAVPGTVNFDAGSVVTAPNLPSLKNFQLGAVLKEKLGCAVVIENDANAAAAGEMWYGAAQGFKDIICLTLGTGVGGGIILEGKIWRGIDGSAGEIGHMGVDSSSELACNCGSKGCLELFASATAVVRMTREMQNSYPGSTLSVDEGLSSERVYQAGINGDELALAVLRKTGFYLGFALATLVNVLNPEVIVIGGGLANAWGLFEEPMRREVLKRAFAQPAQRVLITRAQCGDDAGLLGAARLAFKL